MGSKIVTAQNIDEILEKNELVVLDFWASWCEPCKVFGPIFESVAKKNPDIFFGKVNTEIELVLGEDFQIRSIPTLVILKERTIILDQPGSIPEYLLVKIVNEAKAIDVSKLEAEEN
ncbi:thioredoxin family protein [Bacteriovorax sp. PP10]|uniref:Thioredoxin n=1 Tax=Bacteriovorax antarcticus TaxID=3088717 RepID=A0ABU5VRU1_9BACT|nr:thioredoxin family protein [Bacteriovorax sp. PP10]MEA9355307.1 thioredoxin family protein [Bacteriovorax sp. PP10]